MHTKFSAPHTITTTVDGEIRLDAAVEYRREIRAMMKAGTLEPEEL